MFGLFVFEKGEKPDDGWAGAELSETGEEDGGVNQHTCQSDLFLCQVGGDNKKSGDKADGHSQVVDESASDALFDDYAHDCSMFSGRDVSGNVSTDGETSNWFYFLGIFSFCPILRASLLVRLLYSAKSLAVVP